jgi:formylglycine-generating enzyme required for sulfatase activity
MLETQVTQLMWESVMGSNPSKFKGLNSPVETVSWYDCQKYIAKINDGRFAPAGYKFSLPTEAQWEYACRTGTTTPFNFGSVLNGDKANCNGNYPYGTSVKGKYLQRTTEVGSYPANAWGLSDMHGNVWEWCADWYGSYPGGGAVVNPVGSSTGSRRVFRGGGWNFNAGYCRSAYRDNGHSSLRGSVVGLRLSLVSQ